MLQYFPVDRVCSRVCSTGKFQFPLYERKQRNDSADMFGITHLIHHLTIKHVFYFICTFMMCSWTPHAEKTSTLWNHWVRRWSGACVNGSVDVWANCSDRVPVFFHSAHVVPGPRDVLICESGLSNSSDTSVTSPFVRAKKQSAKDAEYEDLEYGYMYLCTQIYIRNDSVQQYHDFHYVYIHINLLRPYILQSKETPLPRHSSAWRSN